MDIFEIKSTENNKRVRVVEGEKTVIWAFKSCIFVCTMLRYNSEGEPWCRRSIPVQLSVLH